MKKLTCILCVFFLVGCTSKSKDGTNLSTEQLSEKDSIEAYNASVERGKALYEASNPSRGQYEKSKSKKTNPYIKRDCYAAISQSAHKELIKACVREDMDEVYRMLFSGEAVPLGANTEVYVVERGFFETKIRVNGATLWVSAEDVVID